MAGSEGLRWLELKKCFWEVEETVRFVEEMELGRRNEMKEGGWRGRFIYRDYWASFCQSKPQGLLCKCLYNTSLHAFLLFFFSLFLSW